MEPDHHPLRRWRTRHEISLRQLSALLAEQAGIAMSYVSLGRIERGEQDPTWALLLALMRLSGGALSLVHWVPPAIAAELKLQFKKEKRHAPSRLGNPRLVALGAANRATS